MGNTNEKNAEDPILGDELQYQTIDNVPQWIISLLPTVAAACAAVAGSEFELRMGIQTVRHPTAGDVRFKCVTIRLRRPDGSTFDVSDDHGVAKHRQGGPHGIWDEADANSLVHELHWVRGAQ